VDTVHECDRQTDRQTDGRRELRSQRPCNAERRTVTSPARFHNSCASLAGHVLSFIARFILLVIAPLTKREERSRREQQPQETISRRDLTPDNYRI